MDISNIIGQMMEDQMKAMNQMRSGMMQQQAANSPFFMLPPPGLFPPMWEEDEHEHEHEEDA